MSKPKKTPPPTRGHDKRPPPESASSESPIYRSRSPSVKVESGGAGEVGVVVAYTDGACSGNPGPAGLGVVLKIGAGRKEISEYLGEATNNIAELTAILRALEAVQTKDRPVRIYTDSTYAIGVLTKNWKPKLNLDLIATIRREIAKFADVRLLYVPGHSGVPDNERADCLAREAITTGAGRPARGGSERPPRSW